MGRYEDLTGNRYGVFTLLERIEDIVGKNDNRPQYLVKCEVCGSRHKRSARTLKRSKNKWCDVCRPRKSYYTKPSKPPRRIQGFLISDIERMQNGNSEATKRNQT